MKVKLIISFIFLSSSQLLSVSGYKITVVNEDSDLIIRYEVDFLTFGSICERSPGEDKPVGSVNPKMTGSIDGKTHSGSNCCIKNIIVGASGRVSAPQRPTRWVPPKWEPFDAEYREYKRKSTEFYDTHPLPAWYLYKPKNGCKSVTLHVKEVDGKLVVRD